MKTNPDRVLSMVLTGAAVLVAAAVVKREFFPMLARPAEVNVVDSRPPELVQNWENILITGVLIGDSLAPVKIVEFTDLECPFCRRFHQTVAAIRGKYGSKVGHVVIHFPLAIHRFALSAAQAAECAGEQMRFGEFVDQVFGKQDSLGLLSWNSYATQTGVGDLSRFDRCVARLPRPTRIDSGLALGNRLALKGTPTVFINGWRYYMPPDEGELTRAIELILAGKTPFATNGQQ